MGGTHIVYTHYIVIMCTTHKANVLVHASYESEAVIIDYFTPGSHGNA